jgi:glycosyltransferase involved in cell wall biosynthesis
VVHVTGESIWILNHYAITPDLAGGTRHFDLGKELVERGYEVVIFASGFDHVSKKYTKVGSKEPFRVEELEGIRFVWLNTLPYHGNDWRRVANMLSYGLRVIRVARHFQKPDVVIGSSMHPIAALAGWWLARRYRGRFIFEVRDLWPQTAIDMGAMKATGLSARLLYVWEKLMCERAEKVIVLMPNARQYYEGQGIASDKIHWIPNGVDLQRYHRFAALDPVTEAGLAFEQRKDKFKVVYAGAHGSANGLDTIIEAAAVLVRKGAPVHFILVGDGPERPALRAKATQLGCNNVTFLEPVPKTCIPALLRQADLLLLHIRRLGVHKYGASMNKLNDYLASGRPIIMAGATANDVVAEAQAGLTVPPGDAEALADGILRMLEMSKDQRERLGANGRAYVEEHHNISMLGEALAKLL